MGQSKSFFAYILSVTDEIYKSSRFGSYSLLHFLHVI